MSKRCNEYDRIPRDFYATPAKAVAPPIPYLRAAGIKTFAEPCCGEGDLVGHLESYSLRCAYAGDIATGQDALALDDYGDSDSIVTNPPWSREVLHRLIPHFARIAPTWLLLDSDWAQTKQAVPFLPHCSDLLPIGRDSALLLGFGGISAGFVTLVWRLRPGDESDDVDPDDGAKV